MILREAKVSYNTIGEIESQAIDSSEKIAQAARKFLESFDPEREHFCVIALNRKNKMKGISLLSSGTGVNCLLNPAELFRPLILQSAPAFAVFHNHPSGDPAPSRADIQVTRQIREAAKVMSIEFLDHVILGEKLEDPNFLGYYSFNEAGLV
jgi:DNA repair protein RadC